MKPRLDLRAALTLTVAAGLCAWAMFTAPGLARTFGSALGRLNVPALLVVCLMQGVGTGLCACSLRAVATGAAFWTCLRSRWVRDGASNLLPAAPGLGEFAGARILGNAGLGTRLVLGATAADLAAETLSQAPYVVLGLALAPAAFVPMNLVRLGSALRSWSPALLAGAALLALACVSARALWSGGLQRLSRSGLINQISWPGFRRAMAWHFAAWVGGGLQLWVGSHLLGAGLSLSEALAMESLVYAGRALFFFIPAGAGIQEASFLGLGTAMGVPPAAALAFSLLFRVRDAALGVPALLVWAASEHRRLRIRYGQASPRAAQAVR